MFATFAVTEHIASGQQIFNVAFFVVLLSTMLQGTTIEPLARLLGVTSRRGGDPRPAGRAGAAQPARRGGRCSSRSRHGDAVVGHPVRELGLPREALLNVIVRGDRAIPPRGSTVIESGDQLHMLVRQEVAVEFRDVCARWRTGPFGRTSARARAAQPPRGHQGAAVADVDGNPSRPATVNGLRSSSSCAPAATSRARSSRSPTAASRSPARCWPSGLPASCRAWRDGGSARAATPAERAWWQEVVGALAR